MWFVYIVRCSDLSLYTGITTDLTRRIKEHNSISKTAATYTRTHRPVTLVYVEQASSRSEALKREAAIKRMPKSEKTNLISTVRQTYHCTDSE
ncbi:MAG TPA: GIY-YIG nuclease family protein [Patescibacteria group bacterium]|nr:GIY-YIG nuclease family protein [Patescibacteria group bacterium]